MLLASCATGAMLMLTAIVYSNWPSFAYPRQARRALPPWAARLPLCLGDALDSVCIALTGFSLLFVRGTVPEAAARAAAAATQQKSECILGLFEATILGNQPTLIVTNRKLANQILESKNFHQRPAADAGLKELGMYRRGIIWNNDLGAWHLGRRAFQRALNSDGMKSAEDILKVCIEEALKTFQEESGFVDMKQFFQRLTLDFTLRWAFGCTLPLPEREELGHDVTAYFVAWEYFLLRQSWWTWWPWSEARRHKDSQRRLFNKVVKLLKDVASIPVENKAPFVNNIMEATASSSSSSEEAAQLALEMLIAGTDTSSISLYYCLLLLVDRKKDLAALRRALRSPDLPATKSLLSSCLLEVIRMKTVGPVIMRKCTKSTSLKLDAGEHLHIAKGTNVIIDNATMHQDDDLFATEGAKPASEFQMGRWTDDKPDKADTPSESRAKLRPFGSNGKGCVGEHLAKLEMRKILTALLKDFDFERHPSTASFQHLQTQWQVANVPLGDCLFRPIPRPLVTGVFLIGPPSAGKTTLLNLLKGALQCERILYLEETARELLLETGINRTALDTAATSQVLQDKIFKRQKMRETEAFQMLQNGEADFILADRSLLCPLVFGEITECNRSFLDGLRDELGRHYDGRPIHFIVLPPEAKFWEDDDVRYYPADFSKAEAMLQHYTATLDKLDLPYTVLHNCPEREHRVDAVLALPLPTNIT